MGNCRVDLKDSSRFGGKRVILWIGGGGGGRGDYEEATQGLLVAPNPLKDTTLGPYWSDRRKLVTGHYQGRLPERPH